MTPLEEIALILRLQLDEGDWVKTPLELIETALQQAYEMGRKSVEDVP